MLILSDDDVKASMTMVDAIRVNADAFRLAVTPNATQVPERIHIGVADHGVTLFKPALVGDALGLKVVSVRPRNADVGAPTVPGVIMMTNAVTGAPRALLAATYLTALRTAAGSGVATNLFANNDATVLAVFGAGMQACEHINAVLAVRSSVNKIYIVNRGKDRAISLANNMTMLYPSKSFTPLYDDNKNDAKGVEGSSSGESRSVSWWMRHDVETAVRSAHIICATTGSATPVFDGRWVSKGCHINGVGSYLGNQQELDAHIVSRCRIVIDSPAALSAGDLAIPLSTGVINASSWTQPVASSSSSSSSLATSPIPAPSSPGHDAVTVAVTATCGVLNELGRFIPSLTSPSSPTLRLRESIDDITFFKSVGTAVQDIATANAVIIAAEAKKLGTIARI